MTNSFNILINSQSGTASALGQAKIEAWIEKAGLNVENFCFLEADAFFDRLADFTHAAPHLLIGGGDGTIMSAALTCMKAEKPFGVLPLGTMNLLAKDLDVPETLEDALKAYAMSATTRQIDAGFVNDELFLCNASLGTIPETAKIREEHRKDSEAVMAPLLAFFVLDQLDESYHRNYAIKLDDRQITIKSPMLVISNNCLKDTGYAQEKSFKRLSMNDNVLGVYSSQPRNFWEKMRFFFKLGKGGWRKDSVVKEWRSRNVSITSEQEEELVSLDGENKTLTTPLKFKVEHDAIQVLVPGGDR